LKLLEMIGIRKQFSGVIAVDDVDFDVEYGEIHVLLGENGAGKSTLMKVLSGILKPDAGKIILEGNEVKMNSILEAQKHGISMIHQELNLCDNLTVAENIYLGLEETFNISRKSLFAKADELLSQLNFEIESRKKVKNLNASEKQLVSIAKALSRNAKILIMDEPTASITEHEVQRLFEIMKDLKRKNIGIVFISHRLDEVFAIADRVTVLRDGRKVGVGKIDEFDRDKIIQWMIGRKLSEMYPKSNVPSDEVILEVKDFSIPGYVNPISFEVRRGEIFGISGLVGCGKSEVALGLFGAIRGTFKKIKLFDREIPKLDSPLDALKMGIVMIPEDRKALGLILDLSIAKNIIVANTDIVSTFGQINWKKANEITQEFVNKLSIKTPSVRVPVKNLSGGNQQKVVVAKYLLKKPRLAIFVEPTRGIDVGAKVEIYKLINNLVQEGTGVIFISSELPEVVNLCDRVAVMHRGSMTALLERDEISQENIMKAAVGC